MTCAFCRNFGSYLRGVGIDPGRLALPQKAVFRQEGVEGAGCLADLYGDLVEFLHREGLLLEFEFPACGETRHEGAVSIVASPDGMHHTVSLVLQDADPTENAVEALAGPGTEGAVVGQGGQGVFHLARIHLGGDRAGLWLAGAEERHDRDLHGEFQTGPLRDDPAQAREFRVGQKNFDVAGRRYALFHNETPEGD